MPTPSKPISVLKAERKSHRTKAELTSRERAEKALLSGSTMKELPEVKKNPKAHKEFLRVRNLLNNIGKNDAIYEQSVNRYCVMLAEESDLKVEVESLKKQIMELDDSKSEFEDLKEFYKLRFGMAQSLTRLDKQVQEKRKMLLSIEKENAMTISAALRAIPKQPESAKNPLLEILGGG